MKFKPITKITGATILLILFPVLLFTIIELNSIRDNELVIENIYQNQLESILLSVNRFSEDVIRDWSDDIENLINQNNLDIQILQNGIKDITLSIEPLISVFFADTGFSDIEIISKSENVYADELETIIRQTISSSDPNIERLLNYKESGYKKIEPLEDNSKNFNLVLFILDNSYKDKFICGFVIDPDDFIIQILSPKIQEVSQEDFIITVIDDNSDKLVYNSENTDKKTIQQKRKFWLFPDYSIGIILKGETIEEIVKSRSYTNILIIVVSNIFIFIGIWFLYKNIKKQIELAQIKSDFVSNVSHELRTPLALISMFSETLEMNRIKDEAKRNEYYKIISMETNRLSRIVNSILNFSKIEAGKREYKFSDLDINDLVEDILNTYRYHLEKQGFTVAFNKSANISSVSADREALSEVIFNLMDNAVKYSTDKKVIIIKTFQDNNFVYFRIEDKGIGISNKEKKRIFEKFFRATTGSVHNTKGTGLGLTIVKHILDAHNAKIELESTQGKGSVFTVKLPFDQK